MAFVFIIILSSLFRLTFLSTIEFKTDEAVALFLASRPLFGHPFVPGATVSSFGILNSPLFIYILFPFTLISTNPKIVSALIGLLNVLAIGFFYLLVKKYYNKPIAFFASALIAVSPWAIIFSRKIWTQDLIFPFSVPLLYSLHKIIVDKKTFYWSIYTLFSLLLLQLHQSMLFFLLPLNIFLIIKKPKYNFRFILIGLTLGIIPLVPYVIFDAQNGFGNLLSLLNTTQKVSVQNHLEVFMRPFQIINQGNFRFIFGDDIGIFAQNYPLIFKSRIIFYFEYLLLIFGAIIFFKTYPNFRFYIYLSFILPFVYFILRIPAEMHYFIVLMPFLFIFVGTFFSHFWLKEKIFKFFASVLFACIILVSIIYNLSFFKFLEARKSLSGDYGTIFEINEERSKKLDKYKNLKEYQEILMNSYINPNIIRDNKTFTKMIYSSENTKKNLLFLENRIKQISDDKRIRNELLAYYTAKIPSRDDLLFLQKKSKEITIYEEIYLQAYNLFLDKNLLNVYDNYGFTFEYPRHWKLSDDSLVLSSDDYIFSIIPLEFPYDQSKCTNFLLEKENTIYKKNTVKLLDLEAEEKTCEDSQNNWCETSYCPLSINNKFFALKASPSGNIKINTEEAKGIINIITSSLRRK